jgi:hypothetical protein
MEKLHSSLFERRWRACPYCGSPHVLQKEDVTHFYSERWKCQNCLKTFNISYEDKAMGNDLFVMLNNNKFSAVLEDVERKVEELVANRHDYPIWPMHDGEMDAYEKSFHSGVRHSYYVPTITMIQVLRHLRNIS